MPLAAISGISQTCVSEGQRPLLSFFLPERGCGVVDHRDCPGTQVSCHVWAPERHGDSVSCQLEDWTGSEANQGPDPPAWASEAGMLFFFTVQLLHWGINIEISWCTRPHSQGGKSHIYISGTSKIRGGKRKRGNYGNSWQVCCIKRLRPFYDYSAVHRMLAR